MIAAVVVSRETEVCIYEQLLEWAAWATDRRDIPDRRDDVAGDFRLTETAADRIKAARRGDLTPQLEAIEKSVAGLRFEHDDLLLNFMVVQYFLHWKTIEQIAIDQNMSEHHVVEYLQRAKRILAREIPMRLKGAAWA